MKLGIRQKIFSILIFSLSCIILVGFLQAEKIHTIIIAELGGDFARSQLLRQKERLKGVIERELSLSRAMSTSATIQHWAINETDKVAKDTALAELDNFRRLFRSGSWFAVFDATKNYYYSSGQETARLFRPLKTLETGLDRDRWYFLTLNNTQEFTLNIDFDKEVGKTNLWINMIMKRQGVPIGIIGTGLDLTDFIRDFVVSDEEEIASYVLYDDGSIFVSRDKQQMRMRVIARDASERKQIYSMVPEKSQEKLRQAITQAIADPDRIVTLELVFDDAPRIAALTYMPSLDRVILSTINVTNIFKSKNIITSLLAILGVAIAVLMLFSLLMDKLVITPVRDLKRGADNLRNGDYSTRFMLFQKDEIGDLKKTFNIMAEEIEANVNLLEQRVVERTEELAKSRNKLAILLNSSGEGYLKFNGELVIDSEYSSVCRTIFGKEIDGARLHLLLFPDDEARRESFLQIVSGITKQHKRFLKEIMLDLLPEELHIDESYFSMRYLLGSENDYILIMKDITAQKALSQKIEESERQLSFVVEFINEEFSAKNLIEEFGQFCHDLKGMEGTEIIHRLHTFKGNFLQKGFIHLPPVLHDEESRLLKHIRSPQDGFASDTARMKQGLEEDIAILQHYLGEQTMDETRIKISFERLLSLAEQARTVNEELYRSIAALLQTPLHECLKQFEKTVHRLATQEDKEVLFILDCPQDIQIFYPDYSGLISSMYHLISNAVIHGIESPEGRSSINKTQYGTVTLRATIENHMLLITVCDDGKGISPIAEGMANVSIEQIFEDGISSTETADMTSGRGVGLGSIKQEVEKHGGTISFTSTLGSGTTISLSIPLKE